MKFLWQYIILLWFIQCINGRIHHFPQCEKIGTPICQNLGYNTTLMPNFVGHHTQHEAAKGLQTFQPLLHYNCSSHLRLFVCSVFIPFCSEHVPGAVPACRDLCETVREDCLPILERFLLPWPAQLECSRFPAPPALCMQVPTAEDIEMTINASTLVTVEVTPGFSHCPPRFAAIDDSCSPLCGEDAYYRSSDKRYTKIWTLVWSSVCILITTVTLLSFWLDRSRFKYPERPLVFLTLLCFVYAVFVAIRTSIGAELFICSDGHLVTKSADNSLCSSSSFVLHHLELSIRMWWLIFCVCWYLHAACEWSNESLINVSTIFHSAVYIVAGLPALLALATGHTSADELTGSCSIKEESYIIFIVIPHSFILISGGFFCLGAAFALTRVRRSLLATGRCVSKLERLMIRLAVFTALFLLPEVTYLVCSMYESWHRPWWKSLALLSALDCRSCSHEPVYHTASLHVVFLRIMSNMLVPCACLMWVCSRKTCGTWLRVLHSPRKATMTMTMPIPITKV